MTFFWVAAAGLLLLALGLMLPTLFRHRPSGPATVGPGAARANVAILAEQLRQLDAEHAAGSMSDEQHRVQREEIERRVLDEESVGEAPQRSGPARKTAIGLTLLLPLFVFGAYGLFGNVAALDPAVRHAQADPQAEITMAQVEEMVEKLALRLETQPAPGNDDLQGWTMLARSYTALQRFEDAKRSYERAMAMAPEDAQLMADQADVLGALQGQKLSGEPMRLIKKALRLDPRNAKALALAGGGAYENSDFEGAIRYWTQARQAVPPDSDFARGLDASILDARAAAEQRAKAGTAGSATTANATATAAGSSAAVTAAASGAAPAAAAAATPGAQVRGRVSLAPALAARAAPGDTVFVYARAAEGPRAPLAVLRRTVADLPFEFTLDDSMAMAPQLKLSNFALVVVGARVSKSGNATPQSGDLHGLSAPGPLGGKRIDLLIDGVQP